MQALYTTTHRVKSKAPRDPWWTRPHLIYCVPAALVWVVILYTYIQYHITLPEAETGLSKQDKAAIPCNPAHRPVATCAHRGNAAELLGKAGAPKAVPVFQQMQLLWKAGIMCFDMDVVQLKGGDMIVGHPADLAAQVDAAALPGANSSSAKRSARIAGSQLQDYRLLELRSAGLSEQAAPTVQSFLQQFKQLLDSHTAGSTGANKLTSVQEAMQQRNWVNTPLVSLEPKGPAAADAQAFVKVSELAAAAGVSQHTVLWLRQMPAAVVSSTSGNRGGMGGVVVTDLAKTVKQGMANSSTISTGSDTADGPAAGQLKQRPLLGLIVADVLLKQPGLSALQQAGDVSKLTAALLATAGGVGGSSSTSEEGAAIVLDTFDVLAPSIKLPPRVLQSFVASKPCPAWTLEGAAHARKAMWLGIDVAITNTPMAQLAVVQQEEGSFCNS